VRAIRGQGDGQPSLGLGGLAPHEGADVDVISTVRAFHAQVLTHQLAMIQNEIQKTPLPKITMTHLKKFTFNFELRPSDCLIGVRWFVGRLWIDVWIVPLPFCALRLTFLRPARRIP
jgi:hypothetical protein